MRARAHTHTHTDIHIILQQDDVWAEDGVCMYEGRDMINYFNCTVPIRFTTASETSQKLQKQSGVNKFVQK
jgi:hypothetical protein